MKNDEVDIVVAVAGPPNVGKSTLLNKLVGALSHVGNWPGKTVEIITGTIEYKGYRIQIVDLPGTYGLSGVTEEEEIARKYILGEYGERVHRHRRFICESCPLSRYCVFSILCPARIFSKVFQHRTRGSRILYTPDIVVVLVDATLLEKTLYLAISVLELTPHVVIALNKVDELEEQGISIDTETLSKRLKVPVVPISALKGKNIDKLLDTIILEWKRIVAKKETLKIDYGVLEHYIQRIIKLLEKIDLPPHYPRRWVAIRLLEKDNELFNKVRELNETIASEIENIVREAEERFHDELSAVITRVRYNYIAEITRDVITRKEIREPELRLVDRIFTHTIIGPVLSIGLLFLIFIAAFSINIGFPLNILFSSFGLENLAEAVEEYSLVTLMENIIDLGIGFVRSLLEPYSEALASFVADGILGGLGLILTFFPLIMLVLFIISLLEDSGLAARITVALDTLFSRLGLTGRAVFPLIISLGCNVPGVMASRTSMSRGERLALILSAPFVICQARLIVLIAVVSAAFVNPLQQTLAFLGVYLISILLYLIFALIFVRIFGEKGEVRALIMDIPPLRRPSIRVAGWNAWIMGKEFIKKAGTVIVALSVLTWFLLNYGPNGYTANIEQSYGALIGKYLSPLAYVWGITNMDVAWKIMFALLYGFIAKEGLLIAIAQLGKTQATFQEVWRSFGLTPIQSFALLLFFMTYVPCMATVVAIKHETNSWKLTIFSILLMVITAIALSSFIVFLFNII
ncbi:MAG: ferrous iron transport protein B [Candidatus Njordarchaeales archaeon]